jgi:hypothetical protein
LAECGWALPEDVEESLPPCSEVAIHRRYIGVVGRVAGVETKVLFMGPTPIEELSGESGTKPWDLENLPTIYVGGGLDAVGGEH